MINLNKFNYNVGLYFKKIYFKKNYEKKIKYVVFYWFYC